VSGAPLIAAEGVSRVLKGTVPVKLVGDVNLAVNAGEFVAITGPSGSGKSSLLYLLGLLDRPTSGRICIEGRDTATFDADQMAALRLGRIGFVFQFHFLLAEFTVLENVLIPMRRLGRLDRRAMMTRAEALLAGLGIADKRDRRPDQLSGGERQRTAIARALANDPAIVLADEPTGNLDSANGRQVFDILARLAEGDGRAVIVVTHELDLAGRVHRQIGLLDGRIRSDQRL
jgi:lipoprotein-releasing system ATP-binding protein